MPLKVAFIGTHGTGKTGLVKLLSAELIKNGLTVEEVTEVARKIKRLGMPINAESTFDAQEAILLEQRTSEITAGFESPKVIVCDRSVLDNFMYMCRGYDKKGRDFYPGKNEDQIRIAMQEQRVQVEEYMHRRPYSALFYVPIVAEEIEDDGTRSVDKEFQLDIDRKLLAYLDSNQVREVYRLPVECLSLDRHEWIDLVKSVLRTKGLDLRI